MRASPDYLGTGISRTERTSRRTVQFQRSDVTDKASSRRSRIKARVMNLHGTGDGFTVAKGRRMHKVMIYCSMQKLKLRRGHTHNAAASCTYLNRISMHTRPKQRVISMMEVKTDSSHPNCAPQHRADPYHCRETFEN